MLPTHGLNNANTNPISGIDIDSVSSQQINVQSGRIFGKPMSRNMDPHYSRYSSDKLTNQWA